MLSPGLSSLVVTRSVITMRLPELSSPACVELVRGRFFSPGREESQEDPIATDCARRDAVLAGRAWEHSDADIVLADGND